MIKKIQVEGLYGAFDHSITLKPENITLILGENGLGKTVILKMLKAFFDKDFFDLQSNLFSKFILTFVDSAVLTVNKKDTKEGCALEFLLKSKAKKALNKHSMLFSEDQRSRVRKRDRSKEYYFDEMYYHIRHFLPFPIERIGPDRWLDSHRGTMYSAQELLEKYQEYFPSHIRKQFDTSLPNWLTDRTNSTQTKLIETQRLLTKIKAEQGEYKSSVIRYSQELIETIKNKTVAATDLASKLDRSYPNRLIKKMTLKSKISDSELGEGLDLLNKRRELLNKVGLIDTEEENLHPITNAINKQSAKNKELLKDVLQVYLDDSNEKLAIYNDLSKRIDLLMEVINKRFLYKRLSIDKSKGFVLTSDITGQDIPLTGLSSGEQHELVLFYQLLFNTEPNSLLLIDEPEISLHISWQNEFINDLAEVIKLNNLTGIIATHSPDIINNNWPLTVQLKGKKV